MWVQRQEDGYSRLKRVILIGDHHQLPPVVKNMAFQKYSHLDQSLFTRFIRLGTPYIQLNAQVCPLACSATCLLCVCASLHYDCQLGTLHFQCMLNSVVCSFVAVVWAKLLLTGPLNVCMLLYCCVTFLERGASCHNDSGDVL